MKHIRNLILSFFVAYAWMNIGGLESTNILLLCVFASSFIVLKFRDDLTGNDKDQKKIKIASYSLGVLFTVFYALFDDLSGELENRLFIAVFVICSMIGLFVMFQVLLEISITAAVRFFGEKKNLTRNAFSFKILLLYAVIVFICCMPFLAFNYPGVLTVDSMNQLGQVMGIEEYSNHHPWIHTAIINLFYKIGYGISGSEYVGIAFYTFFQVIIVSLSIGYSLECMYEFGLGRKIRIILLLCFILMPYNLMYAVTMWKDILFSMSVLVMTITIMRINFSDSIRDRVMFVVCGFFMCVLRHNGLYAFIATAAIWLFINRNNLKKYIVMALAIILAAGLCRGPVMKACKVAPGEYVYNMCLPLQQIGRVVAIDKVLDEDQINWLEKVNTLDYIRAGFDVQCADPMFAWVLDGDEKFFDSHKGEFIKLWLQLGIKYPLTYIKAFGDLTKGYWTPMDPQQTVYFGMSENALGLYPKPVIEGPVLIKINELITKIYSMIPIYGQFYCMGGGFWLLLVLAAICICNKRADKLYPYLPVFWLTMTLLLATPLVADLRYAYALMLVLPYITVYSFMNDRI